MTDQQINIKIANICGKQPWWRCKNHSEIDGPHCRWCCNEATLEDCPNYAADLNACHQFEKTLTDEQFDAFQIELSRVVFEHPCVVTFPVGFKQRRFWNATARQRCETFLRVHGQWGEA